ncbi:MAG: N-acetylglucosamine-6-phosphate deacetylase [Propionibacteriaceae bacterium]|jgi:N-acetylglucosamine-6-phosphate deacetylase|nr:N-acetylglucosamine-6-phosphate deacetylase [Propionibacteriaceae bacterium]
MSEPILIAAASMLTPFGLIDNGWVEVVGDRIEVWGDSTPPREPDIRIEGVLSPGFVDVHSHGGGGANFGDDPDQIETVLATHLAHGTTTMVGSLVTAGLDDLAHQVEVMSTFVADGRLAGTHLEGPWLATKYKGAHTEKLLLDPRIDDIARILEASHHTVKMVTMAPEKTGGIEAVSYLADHGVMVAIGHTAADFDTTQAAIAAGARGTTHLFNAMPDLLHRSPGPALALWRDPRVWVELICDGVHVHPALVAEVMQTKADHAVLVTDAMAAAAFDDGDYSLGGLPVEVRDSVARIAGTSTIAGSTLTLDRAVRTAIGAGVDPGVVLQAATANPADYLGLEGVGRITKGNFADLTCLDADFNVTRVMRRGVWAK